VPNTSATLSHSLVGSALVAATVLLLTTSPGNATGAVDERAAEVCWYEPTTMVGTSGNDVVRPRQSPGEDIFAMLGARTGFTQATAATGSAGMPDRTSSTAILEETHYEAPMVTTSCWEWGDATD
jgi:hypothetical protein